MARNVPKYRHTVRVKNVKGYEFPDHPDGMLRYDGLVPASDLDRNEISLQKDNPAGKVDMINRETSLTRFASADWEPTYRRWESFGFEVIEHTKEQVKSDEKSPPPSRTQEFAAVLEIDQDRGVIYVHSAETGRTLLRICRLPTPIPLPSPTEFEKDGLDITFGQGVSWHKS